VSWENLGASYAAQKLWSESLRSYRKALELAKKDRANADIERVTLSLAEVSFDGGNASEGAKYVSEWLPLHNASGDLLTLEEARIVDKAATALSDAKQYAAAEPALRVLLDAGDQPGSHSVNMNRVLLQLAEVYAAENKNAEAAPLYERLGLRNRAIGRLPDAEQYLLKAKNLRDKAPGPKGEGLVAALQELGNTYVQERKFSDAQAAFDQARTILQKNDLATDPRMAISLNGLGAVQEGQSNSEEAAKLYNQAYDLLKQSPDPPAGIMVSVLYHLGSQALAKNNMADAKTYFDQCVAISEKRNYTPENPPPVDQLDMIAGAYERQGNFDQAEKLYKRNLELRTTSFGENSVEQAWGLFSLAVYYNGRKQYDQAVEYGEKALHIFEAKSGEESDEVAFVLSTLANAYGAKGDLQRAMAATARSVDIQEKLKRPRDEITNSLSALGEYSLRSKKYQDALDAYQKLAKLWEPEMFASPNYQRAAANIAATYVYLNDVQDGNQWYDRLQKALQQQHDTMQLPSFARRYADALQAIGHEKDAKKIRDRAGIANNRGRE
jgi:tetratricopeptide (TPR) repeat protein